MSRSSSSVAACWPAWHYLAFCLEPWSHSETRPSVYFHTDYRLPDSTWPGLGLALVAFAWPCPLFCIPTSPSDLQPISSSSHRAAEHHMHAIDDNDDDDDDVDGSRSLSLSHRATRSLLRPTTRRVLHTANRIPLTARHRLRHVVECGQRLTGDLLHHAEAFTWCSASAGKVYPSMYRKVC